MYYAWTWLSTAAAANHCLYGDYIKIYLNKQGLFSFWNIHIKNIFNAKQLDCGTFLNTFNTIKLVS